jgi:alanine dehydrogenase
MIIGVPKEVKNNEFRVGMLPWMVKELTTQGHEVIVESNAGVGAGYNNAAYLEVGGIVVDAASEVWARGEMIVKVKEPTPSEYPLIRENHILFTYLHLAASKDCTQALVNSGVRAYSYETLSINGTLPLLAPMSEIAGKLASQMGAHYLLAPNGGNGVLMSGVAGVEPAKVLVLGAGEVGLGAIVVAEGMRAEVTVLDIDQSKLAKVTDLYRGRVKTLISNKENLERELLLADVVIGGVLLPGAKAPKLVTKDMVARMKPGSVLVDVAIDQGGCFEGSYPTTHQDPVYKVHNSTYYSVANMPGSVPVTATKALTNATFKYIQLLANNTPEEAHKLAPELISALNVDKGRITNEKVTIAFNS